MTPPTDPDGPTAASSTGRHPPAPHSPDRRAAPIASTTAGATATGGPAAATGGAPGGVGRRVGEWVSGFIAAHPVLRQSEREARVWAHGWKGAAVTGVLSPLLFLGAMGLGLGGLVDENAGDVEGLSYLVFVTPGILAAAALQSAAGDAMWPVMSGIKWTKTFHAAAATPLSPRDVHGGYLVWVGVRLAMNAVIFLVVAALLGGVPSAWGVLSVPVAVAGGLAFAAPLSAYSAGQDSDMGFPIIMRILVMPMYLFSGTFFAVDQLPSAVRPLAWVSPLWHAVELCRGATTASAELVPAAGHIAYLAAFIAAGWWWGGATFGRKLAS